MGNFRWKNKISLKQTLFMEHSDTCRLSVHHRTKRRRISKTEEVAIYYQEPIRMNIDSIEEPSEDLSLEISKQTQEKWKTKTSKCIEFFLYHLAKHLASYPYHTFEKHYPISTPFLNFSHSTLCDSFSFFVVDDVPDFAFFFSKVREWYLDHWEHLEFSTLGWNCTLEDGIVAFCHGWDQMRTPNDFSPFHPMVQFLSTHFYYVKGMIFSEREVLFFNELDHNRQMDHLIQLQKIQNQTIQITPAMSSLLNNIRQRSMVLVIPKQTTVHIINPGCGSSVLKKDFKVLQLPCDCKFANLKDLLLKLPTDEFNPYLYSTIVGSQDAEIHPIINFYLLNGFDECLGVRFPDNSIELTKI